MRFFLIVLLIIPFHFLFSQNTNTPTHRDTVITSNGDTLVGKIDINKDKNKYILKVHARETELDPLIVQSFVIYPNDGHFGRQAYYSIIGDFYLLQSGKNDPITLYAKSSYEVVEDDGPKYYIVKNKYCVFKNNTPYFPNKDIFKEVMVFLTNDCLLVHNKVRKGVYSIDDLPSVVLEYNQCHSR